MSVAKLPFSAVYFGESNGLNGLRLLAKLVSHHFGASFILFIYLFICATKNSEQRMAEIMGSNG